MKPFEVGERVCVYQTDRRVGTVSRVFDDGRVWVCILDGLEGQYHVKQLRRLIKRGSRVKVSGWMNLYPDNGQSILCPDPHTADAAAFPSRIACVRLVGYYTPKAKP